ncbi:MAG: ferredoxin family protein [Pseudomonadota bacterium]
MPRKNEKPGRSEDAYPRVSIYPAWCKKCGNCVEFCPVKALEQDEWGFPRLAKPVACTACRLCEKLCPDFAISVGEPPEIKGRSATHRGAASANGESSLNRHHSPERVLPALEDREDGQEADRDEE